MNKKDRFKGCIIGGAIGDAIGSGYENLPQIKDDIYYPKERPKVNKPRWQITDDTQLTMATMEAMISNDTINSDIIAQQLLIPYRQKKLIGLGASTLKALRELDLGGHWSQVGRTGEYAAGNGAAMRIAPLAFDQKISRKTIQEICYITHKNDEAYIGAYSVILAIRTILTEPTCNNIISKIISKIPDTNLRDRFIEIEQLSDLTKIGDFGNSGYVVDSVPLAIAAASQVSILGIENMYDKLIKIGGDTDTICSIAGQIAGTMIGFNGIPKTLIQKLSKLYQFEKIEYLIDQLTSKKQW